MKTQDIDEKIDIINEYFNEFCVNLKENKNNNGN